MSLVIPNNNPFLNAPANPLDRVNPTQSETTGSPPPARQNVQPGANNPEEQKEMVMLPAGHGSGCGHCTGMMGGMVPKEKLEAIKAKQYNAIMAHEQAHAAAAGGFGGGIKIDYDSNGIAIGGSVPVQMPALNKAEPERTLRHAHIIRSAALAPTDPSSQDMMIAGQAQSVYTQALFLRNEQVQLEKAGLPDNDPTQAQTLLAQQTRNNQQQGGQNNTPGNTGNGNNRTPQNNGISIQA